LVKQFLLQNKIQDKINTTFLFVKLPHPKLAMLYQIIKSWLGFLCFITEICLQNTLHFGKPAVQKYGAGFQFSNVTDKFTLLPVISSASGRISKTSTMLQNLF
jgi:hypothetical protein